MPLVGTGRLSAAGAVLAGVVVVAGSLAPQASSAPARGAGVVTVATTGDRSELRETIPITRRARAKPKVAMSLAPQQTPSLLEGDRLRITAELQTTNNCYRPSPFCVGPPYRYSPNIGTRLVIADARSATGWAAAKAITKRRVRDCDQQPDNREHHCVRVYGGSNFRIPTEQNLPCRLERCRINLVVDAHHRRARSGDVLILGIDRETGEISGDRGRLNVTRRRGGGIGATQARGDRRLDAELPIRKGIKSTIYSLRLPKLRRGEQLTFDAGATVDINHLSYSAFVGTQLVLASKRTSVHTSEFTRRVGSLDGEVTEANGFNCTQRTTPCGIRRVGTLVVRRDARRGDRWVPLFVNLVLRNAPKSKDVRPGHVMKVRRGGHVEAVRYPADARG